MKLLYLLLLVALTYATPPVRKDNNDDDSTDESLPFRERWLEVPLDHFNLFDNRTWKMRYFVNNEFFQEGNPLFIEVGGEWVINGGGLQQGQMHLLAKQHHGMLVETEHRYYGKSLPFGTDFSTENLKFLQMEQALEDLAYFIEKFKSFTPGLQNSKVVIHGCSYPGMLVTWMRLRFPHIVDISYASSAPLGVGLEYPEYYEVVNDAYANVSISCIDTIREGFKTTAELLKTKTGRKVVKKAFKRWECFDVDEMKSGQILNTMTDILNILNEPVKFERVSCVSLSMDADELSAFERLARFIIQKSEHQGTCSSSTSSEEQEDDGESSRTDRAWSYQLCTEQGTFLTLNRKNPRHPFQVDSNVEESVEGCVADFGEMVTEEVLRAGVERVTRRYGGKKPPVTKVVTVQGNQDPWKHLSHLETYTPEAPIIVVEGNHCEDISAPLDDDPEDLTKVRKDVRQIITDWLKEIS